MVRLRQFQQNYASISTQSIACGKTMRQFQRKNIYLEVRIPAVHHLPGQPRAPGGGLSANQVRKKWCAGAILSHDFRQSSCKKKRNALAISDQVSSVATGQICCTNFNVRELLVLSSHTCRKRQIQSLLLIHSVQNTLVSPCSFRGVML